MTILSDLQSACDRYAACRLAHDAAVAANDVGAAVLYRERLLEAEAVWRPLADAFSARYAGVSGPLVVGEPVVWRRGAVGLQGIVTEIGAICRVSTSRGVFADYADSLMPLSAVEE